MGGLILEVLPVTQQSFLSVEEDTTESEHINGGILMHSVIGDIQLMKHMPVE